MFSDFREDDLRCSTLKLSIEGESKRTTIGANTSSSKKPTSRLGDESKEMKIGRRAKNKTQEEVMDKK